MFVCVQARERAALRETLQAEREASCAEQEALRAVIKKLESEIHEKPQPCPVISEEEVEERRRAEEKAAQQILQLTKVTHIYNPQNSMANFKLLTVVLFLGVMNSIRLLSLTCFLLEAFFHVNYSLFILILPHFKEVQALQREKDSLCKETEKLSDRLIEQEKAQEGSIIFSFTP